MLLLPLSLRPVCIHALCRFFFYRSSRSLLFGRFIHIFAHPLSLLLLSHAFFTEPRPALDFFDQFCGDRLLFSFLGFACGSLRLRVVVFAFPTPTSPILLLFDNPPLLPSFPEDFRFTYSVHSCPSPSITFLASSSKRNCPFFSVIFSAPYIPVLESYLGK